jgi:hypothetical protein
VEPTVIGYNAAAAGGGRGAGGSRAPPLADLDFTIGQAALDGPAAALTYPMRGGIISDFDVWCVSACMPSAAVASAF